MGKTLPEVVERLRKLTSPDAEMLSDGYRLTEIIKLNPADALQSLHARVEAAERERDEARLDRITAERDAQNMANQLVAAIRSLGEQ